MTALNILGAVRAKVVRIRDDCPLTDTATIQNSIECLDLLDNAMLAEVSFPIQCARYGHDEQHDCERAHGSDVCIPCTLDTLATR